MMMLAEMFPDTPVGLAAWIACAFFLIAFANSGMKLVDRIKGSPPPEQLHASATELEERITRLEDARADDLREASLRRKATYDHIDLVRREIKEDIRALQENISEIPSQVIATLKNTGAI